MDNVSSFVVHNTGGSWATANDNWIDGLYANTATVSNAGSTADYWTRATAGTTSSSHFYYSPMNFKISYDDIIQQMIAEDEPEEESEETWCEEYKDDPDYIEQFLSEFALAVAGGESA